MKSTIIAAILMVFGAGMVNASNYPSDYYSQKVRVVATGPAIVASISGGAVSARYVIGYKRSGILGGAGGMGVVVRAMYMSYSGGTRSTERIMQIGKEWQGTGFMTPAMSLIELTGDNDAMELLRLELAFSSGSQWDSNWGGNYTVTKDDFRHSPAVFSSSDDAACWNFIVEQMRK